MPQQSQANVTAVAHLTVVSLNMCSKKGVQLRLLLLPLVLRSLCGGLCWLVLRHCKVVGLATSKGVGIWTNQQASWRVMVDARAGLLAGSLVNKMGGVLVGLLVGSLVGTLGNCGCGCMECMILLLSSIWVVGTLVGACTCTLGTCCVLRVAAGVVVS